MKNKGFLVFRFEAEMIGEYRDISILPLSEGIAILKKMVGEEEKKEERTYSLNEVREIALEYYNLYLYAESHKLTRFELQSELIKINQKYNLDYKEGVDFNQPKPTE